MWFFDTLRHDVEIIPNILGALTQKCVTLEGSFGSFMIRNRRERPERGDDGARGRGEQDRRMTSWR